MAGPAAVAAVTPVVSVVTTTSARSIEPQRRKAGGGPRERDRAVRAAYNALFKEPSETRFSVKTFAPSDRRND
ncbi:hypothetical protein Ssi03_57940 [Sphaerisporangium siamense]|nr:hypothetical protein Ssi03_57940 [Sphaerisporangium siamense]